jgi:TRAP-type C4-dicarboxylate transport system permease small subunit
MTTIAVVDVIAVKFFGWSMKGAVELLEEMMVVLLMLPAGYVALERGHISMTLFEERAGRVGRFLLLLLQYLIGVTVAGFFTWRGFVQLQYSIASGQVRGVLNTPVWPAYTALVIGFGFLTLVWVCLLARTAIRGAER